MSFAILFSLLAIYAFIVMVLEISHLVGLTLGLRFAGAGKETYDSYIRPKVIELEQELKAIMLSIFTFVTLAISSYWFLGKMKLIDKVISLLWQINF